MFGPPSSNMVMPGQAYQSMVNQAQTDYGTVMSGYQNAISGQQQGYANLGGQVANTLGYGGTPWGVAAPAAQSIADTYAAQQGNAQQGLINSGLGNSTVLQSVNRGIGLDAAKAYGGLGAQLAQTYAGYQSQLGMAGLQSQAQLQSQQLGYQGAYHQQGYSIAPPRQTSGGGGAIGSPGGDGPLGAEGGPQKPNFGDPPGPLPGYGSPPAPTEPPPKWDPIIAGGGANSGIQTSSTNWDQNGVPIGYDWNADPQNLYGSLDSGGYDQGLADSGWYDSGDS